jgi:hypothetical protein
MQQGNEFGEFYAVVSIDERLPVGVYSFTAQGQSTGRLVISQATITAGSPNVTAYPPDYSDSPTVTDTNSGNPSSLGDVPLAPGVITLDPQPENLTDVEPAPLAPTW